MAKTPTNVSIVGQLLFQTKPKQGWPDQHGRSWKNICGSNRNNWKLQRRHERNAKLIPYKTAGTINILKDLTVKGIQSVWAKITRKFAEAKVVAWWRREVSRYSNRVHYHLVVVSDHTSEELKALVRSSQPKYLKAKDYRLQFETIRNAKHWAEYCCKTTIFDRVGTPSFHAGKVVLFAENVGLAVHDTIGHFWKYKPKPRTKQQKQAYRVKQHKLKEAYSDHAIQYAADSLQGMTNRTGGEIASEFAKQLVADPTSYQSFVDMADRYGAEQEGFKYTPRKVAPFQFSPVPPLPPPPIRKKRTAPKQPFPKFDPKNCDSFTIGVDDARIGGTIT